MADTAVAPNNVKVAYRGRTQRERPRGTEEFMPYVSQSQQGWAHTKEGTEALGGPAKVAEWDAASKGLKLPKHARSRVAKLRKRGLISDRQHAKLLQKHGRRDGRDVDAATR